MFQWQYVVYRLNIHVAPHRTIVKVQESNLNFKILKSRHEGSAVSSLVAQREFPAWGRSGLRSRSPQLARSMA